MDVSIFSNRSDTKVERGSEMDLRKRVVNVRDIFFFSVLGKSLSDCTSVLDVGCGDNSPLRTVKNIVYSEGIDIHKPSITVSKKNKIHQKYRIGDIQDIDVHYKDKSFDAVIAMDVIEHLKKNEAKVLIKKMENISRKKVILLTPNGFHDHEHFDNNPHQEHKSGWTVKELQKLGYRVSGLRSFKFIRGDFATINLKPWLFWGIIAFVTEPVLYYFPELSYHLFAVKKVSKN